MNYSEAQLWDILKSQGKATGPRPADPKPRKKRSNEESQMQRQVIIWWSLTCKAFNVAEQLLFSIPNGGFYGSPVQGSILKAEGLRKGAPDLMLAVPKWRPLPGDKPHPVYGHWEHALFLEFKTRTGVLSKEQETFRDLLQAQGHKVVTVYSRNEAIDQITSYLSK